MLFGPSHEVGVGPGRVAGELDVVEAAEQLLEDGADLDAGEMGAEAEVAAEAEGEVARRVLRADVEAERVGEHLVVAVGRRVRQVEQVAGLERHVAQGERLLAVAA